MKYVDHIIRYLSGDLNTDEYRAFEEQLASDPLLREEYLQVSAAYRIAREGFRRKDVESFRTKLREVMENTPLPGTSRKRRYGPVRVLILSVAAALALFLIILTLTRGEDHLFARFYLPQDDPVILAMSEDSRGNAGPGIALYRRGEYTASYRYLEDMLEEDPDNQHALLFYLLSSIETGKEEEALSRILENDSGSFHPAGRAITWYTALALVKSGRHAEAFGQVQPLVDRGGSYSHEARALQRQLSK